MHMSQAAGDNSGVTTNISSCYKYILVLNAFLHEKQGITWNTSLKASIENENPQTYDEQSTSMYLEFGW